MTEVTLVNNSFKFACPICQSPLEIVSSDEQRCPRDRTIYRCVDGIWRCLRPDRVASLEQFIHEYETIRQAEGRGSADPAYYRQLPFADLSKRFSNDWKIRAASYRSLVAHLIAPLESARRPLKILDLGAGNGWLSYQLAKRGHTVAAIDLLTNANDGLGAHVHYDVSFTPIQSEFDLLPLVDQQADLVIFNSSFHYSPRYETTLAEALRVVNETGDVVIIDTPIYSNASSGAQMAAERHAQFQSKYGFPSNSIASENFLTYQRLNELSLNLGIDWQTRKPFRGWRWAMRPWWARVRGRREPAEFLLISGKRKRAL